MSSPAAPPPVAPSSAAPPRAAYVQNPFAVENPPPEVPEITPPDAPEVPEAVIPTPEPEVPRGTESVKPPSRSQLSEQLETANKTIEQLRSDGDVHGQKLKDALTSQEELTGKLKERDDTFVQSRTPVYRWQNDPEVAGPRVELSEMLTETAADLTSASAESLKKDVLLIIDAYGQARSNGDLALRAFKAKLQEDNIFGDEGDKVYDLVKQMYPKHVKSVEAEQRNGVNHFDRTRQSYEQARRRTTEMFGQLGRWTEQQIKANPDDPNAIISAAVAGDEELQKTLDTLSHRAAAATVGLPPLPPDATPEQIHSYRLSERNRSAFLNTAYESDVKVKMLTPIVKKLMDENAALKRRVEGSASGNDPDIRTDADPPVKPDPYALPKGTSAKDAPNPFLRD